MRFLRTNTAIRLTVGPFFDKTDGVTPEAALTVTNCHLTFMVDDGNVPTLVLDTNPTASGGANDMVHVTGDDAGFYDLELAAANVNYLGRAMLALTDAANHCPVFHEFMILPAVIYDAMVLGTDLFDVSVTQLAGVAQSLTDLKDFADDGYDPATNKVQGVVLTDTVTTYTGNTPQTGDVYPKVDTEVAAIKAKTDNLPAAPAATGDIPTANQNADALLDRAAGVETGHTLRQSMRLMLAALVGKVSGAGGTTVTIRDTGDSKDRITATVDADGNRSAVTLDQS